MRNCKNIYLLLLGCVLILSSCGQENVNNASTQNERIEHDYSEINHAKINYFDVFRQPEEEYYLYYYSENCLHCAMIKNEIIEFSKKSEIPVYFVQVEQDYGFVNDINKTIGAKEPLDAFAKKTPQLSFVTNNEIYYSIIGEDVEIFLFTK